MPGFNVIMEADPLSIVTGAGGAPDEPSAVIVVMGAGGAPDMGCSAALSFFIEEQPAVSTSIDVSNDSVFISKFPLYV